MPSAKSLILASLVASAAAFAPVPQKASSSAPKAFKSRLGVQPNDTASPPTPPAREISRRRRRSLGLVDRVFDAADFDDDDCVDRTEAYVFVLELYVLINQKAPMPPPSRDVVDELHRLADSNGKGGLDREELRDMMAVFTRRLSTRLVLYRATKMLIVPILAVKSVYHMGRSEWVSFLAEKVPGKMGFLRKESFWTSMFMLMFAAVLGKSVLALTNRLLNRIDGVKIRKEH